MSPLTTFQSSGSSSSLVGHQVTFRIRLIDHRAELENDEGATLETRSHLSKYHRGADEHPDAYRDYCEDRQEGNND
jgi:hypothetical protein